MTLGAKIKKLREERGLKQIELSKEINVSRATISYWENDLKKPNDGMLRKLAELFDVELNYLVSNNDDITLDSIIKEKNSLAARLKISREKLNLSQIDMARLCGVASSTIMNYELDRTPIPADIVLKYSEICGVSPNYLLAGKADREEDQKYKDEQIIFYKEQIEFYKQKVKELEEKLKTKK